MSEEVRELVQDTVITLDRLIGLVNDLLALQAHGKSRMDILPRVCPLAEVIKMSIGSLSAYAAEHDVRIESQDTQAVAYADRDRIVQVLVNLLSNAIKFSPRGSSVVVSAVPVDDQVEVRVKDQGRGIPGHQRDAVFERFEQVAATDATEKGGTGLGLPICKEIVERHGGRIGLESEEGKGSTFWFRLPARPQGEE
jgi:signal transduction histidine kinase